MLHGRPEPRGCELVSVCALIAAAGSGRRMGAGVNKTLLPLRGRPVLHHTLLAFDACEDVDEVAVIVPPQEADLARELIRGWGGLSKVNRVAGGGKTRQESVLLGLDCLDPGCDIVVVHDGARPLVRPATISRVIEAAREHGAALAAVPTTDTVKVVRHGYVAETLDRDLLWAATTPQAFRREILETRHRMAAREGRVVTDDAALVEGTGIAVKVVCGEYDNIKITTPEDLVIAEALLAARSRLAGREASGLRGGGIRVGVGFDVHRLVEGRPLVLGGVNIPFESGLKGHSDADVIIHAIADAILGACALGDIGRLFPDDDPTHAGVSSKVILEKARNLAEMAGFSVSNVDAVLIAERPKISKFVPGMQRALADILGIPEGSVSIKATTTEGMGFIGSGVGMACYASCSVVDQPLASSTGGSTDGS